jgi:hypothetical protein
MNTEGGRIASLQEQARCCNASQALARARAFGAAVARCKGTCESKSKVGAELVPAASVYLEKQAAACALTGYTSPYTCVPSSVRTAALQECAIQAFVDPLNPEQRFSDYRRPYFPPPCPPIPQEALNANVPKNQMKSCPLPNKPYYPVLPG